MTERSKAFIFISSLVTLVITVGLSPLYLKNFRQDVSAIDYILYGFYFFCLISIWAVASLALNRWLPRAGVLIFIFGWVYLLIGSLVYFRLGLQLDSPALIGALKASGLNGVQFAPRDWVIGVGGVVGIVAFAASLERWIERTHYLHALGSHSVVQKISLRWSIGLLLAAIYLIAFDNFADQKSLPEDVLPGYAWLSSFRNVEFRPIAGTRPDLTGSGMMSKPDFVFLLADSVRWDLVTAETAPNLYRLMTGGECAVADRHYAGGHMTAYGGFSALYGLNAYNYPAYARAKLSSAALLALKKNGYVVEAFDASGLLFFAPPAVNKSDFDRYEMVAEHAPAYKDDEEITHKIISAVSSKNDQPRFIFGFFYSTHDPYEFPGEGLAARSDDLSNSSDTTLKSQYRRYRSSLHYVDQLVGRILTAADQKRKAGRFAFVFSSDHGEEFGEHGSSGHVKVGYEDVRTRVPMILCLPDKKRFDIPLSAHADLFPTFFSWAGVENRFLNQFDGVSLIKNQRSVVIVAPSLFPTDQRSIAIFKAEKKYRFELMSNALTSLQLKSVYENDRERRANPADTAEIAADLLHLQSAIRSRLKFPNSNDPADFPQNRQPSGF